MLTRGDLVDVLLRDDEALVLTEDTCSRLSAVATAVVVFVDRPRPCAEVEAHVEAVFGPAPPGRLADIIEDLVAQGILRSIRDVGCSVDH